MERGFESGKESGGRFYIEVAKSGRTRSVRREVKVRSDDQGLEKGTNLNVNLPFFNQRSARCSES